MAIVIGQKAIHRVMTNLVKMTFRPFFAKMIATFYVTSVCFFSVCF